MRRRRSDAPTSPSMISLMAWDPTARLGLLLRPATTRVERSCLALTSSRSQAQSIDLAAPRRPRSKSILSSPTHAGKLCSLLLQTQPTRRTRAVKACSPIQWMRSRQSPASASLMSPTKSHRSSQSVTHQTLPSARAAALPSTRSSSSTTTKSTLLAKPRPSRSRPRADLPTTRTQRVS